MSHEAITLSKYRAAERLRRVASLCTEAARELRFAERTLVDAGLTKSAEATIAMHGFAWDMVSAAHQLVPIGFEDDDS